MPNETNSISDELPEVPYCPVGREFVPCPLVELAPLIEHLRRGEAPTTARQFPRGTHLPDGRLDLCKQNIGPLGIEAVGPALRENSFTRHLLLGANGLGNRGARAVAQAILDQPSLETIYLGCNGIEASGAEALSGAISLRQTVKSLWLKRNPIGAEGARYVATMIRVNRALCTLDLVQTELGSEGLRAICEVLLHPSSSVVRLYVGGNRLSSANAKCLAELLVGSPSLRELYLGANCLEDEGTCILAGGLARNRILRRLGLASNGIGAAGAIALAKALREHPALEMLDLGCDRSAGILGAKPNSIGDAGIEALAGLLDTACPLRSLDVQHNGITDRGATHLCRALESNTMLVSLRIGKGISHRLKARLRSLLERNRRERGTPDNNPDDAQRAIRSVYRTAPEKPSGR